MRRSTAISIFVIVFLLLTAAGASKTTYGEQSTIFPNMTAIAVYDVTGENAVGKEIGGTLEASGLNSTLVLSQLEPERQYRVTIAVQNEGVLGWTLESADPLYHAGLNASWEVPKIWYNISGDQDYNGGTFSGGVVNWTSGNGGTVASGGMLYAKYLVNVTQPDSSEFTTTAWVNDTSSSSGSRDVQTLDVNQIGTLSSTVYEPADGAIVKTDTTVPLTVQFSCAGGDCGEVVATARYNASSATPGTLIPSGSGAPLHTQSTNQRVCGTLSAGQACNVTWSINATGGPDTSYEIDANASSTTYADLPEHDSADRTIRLKEIVLFSLGFSTVDFGSVAPGEQNVSALGNDELAYNISVDDDSVVIDDLWIRATELVSDQDASYTIGPGNISVNATIRPDPLALASTYQHFAANIQPNTTFSTFYYLDVPRGILTGSYSGTITYKANATV